jgi:hypothetical protein
MGAPRDPGQRLEECIPYVVGVPMLRIQPEPELAALGLPAREEGLDREGLLLVKGPYQYRW